MGLTPMMQQYKDMKRQVPDALLMFRLGDFYELFFEDAVAAARILDITLTGRDAGDAGRIPMCGVPHHAVEQYIHRLIDKGFRVAICEQMEDPKQVKGLVKRDIVRIVTPGTVVRDEGAQRRILASLVCRRGQAGVGLVDVGTGDVWFLETEAAGIADVLAQWMPSEVLVYDDAEPELLDWLERWFTNLGDGRLTKRTLPRRAYEVAAELLLHQYGVASLGVLDLANTSLSVEALGMVFTYIEETQKQRLSHLRHPVNLQTDGALVLDATAQRNLELLETVRGRNKKGSLYGLLDVTKTSMGARLLRTWLERPLSQRRQIEERLDAVEALLQDVFLRSTLRTCLDKVYDIDRLISRLSFGSANARDLRALAVSLSQLPDMAQALNPVACDLLLGCGERIPDFHAFVDRSFTMLVDEPPVSIREGGLIRSGVDSALDELRALGSSGKTWLAELEQRERERTGIRNLKIGFNKVHGYFIEVSKSNTHLVPEDYERRQTLASGERYALPELKAREADILTAEERAMEREYELFTALRDEAMGRLADIQEAAQVLALIDVLCAFAEVSEKYRYVRPVMSDQRGIKILGGRHPVVEALTPLSFIPNDVSLGDGENLVLLTGPNMAGKSTYMRQTALIVLLAHIGCFIPAKEASIGLVDRIFTRIGASDDLSAGQSTFMVEMVELASILRQATDRSLVLLDEIGRGTSTYDGMSIAEAVMEALVTPSRTPLTMFATHYHELTVTANELPGAVNASVLVQETEDGISFLHTVVKRPADQSYGIQVAKLAGIPESVIERAKTLLKSREAVFHVDAKMPVPAAASVAATNESAMPLFAWKQDAVLQQLAEVDIQRLTPMQAMNLLDEMVQQAREVVLWDESKSSRKS